MARLTIRAYARHRGVSPSAVRKAIASGRIVTAADGSIDPVAADRQWTETTNLSKLRNSVLGVPKKRRIPGARAIRWACLARKAAEPGNGVANGDTARLVANYAGARAAREGYQARLAKLEFEKRSEKLVDADEVRRSSSRLGAGFATRCRESPTGSRRSSWGSQTPR